MTNSILSHPKVNAPKLYDNKQQQQKYCDKNK